MKALERAISAECLYMGDRLDKGGDPVSGIDKHNKLKEEPFSYQTTKKGAVLIFYKGKQIKIVKDSLAVQLLENIHAVENSRELQLLLAKITGNFKHGNEKNSQKKRK